MDRRRALSLPRACCPARCAGPSGYGPGAPPVPPRDDEKYRYIKRGAWILTLASVASFPLLLFSQTRLMMEYHWFWFYVPFVIMGALFLALPMITDGMARGSDFGEHQRLVDEWRPEAYPSVDVFLPVCGEPVDVVRNTWKYVAEMSRHYQGTVTAYVLDDSASPELKAMAREFGLAYAAAQTGAGSRSRGTSVSVSRCPTGTTSCCWTRTSPPGLTC